MNWGYIPLIPTIDPSFRPVTAKWANDQGIGWLLAPAIALGCLGFSMVRMRQRAPWLLAFDNGGTDWRMNEVLFCLGGGGLGEICKVVVGRTVWPSVYKIVCCDSLD